MPKLGRPLALDDANRQIVCAIVAAGGSLEGAARYVGCSPSTVYRYLRRDAQFRERFNAAKVEGALLPFRLLQQATKTNWRAGAWALQQLYPERYDRAEIARRKREEEEDNQQSFRERMLARMNERAALQKSRNAPEPPAEKHPQCEQSI